MIGLLGVSFSLALAPAQAADAQRVVVHAAFTDRVPERVTVTIEQSGTTQTVVLRDDGSTIDDTPGDRVWTGSITGDPAQYLQVALTVTTDDLTRDVYTGGLHVGNARTVEVALEVTTREGGELVGARRTSASPGRVTHAIEALPVLASTFWAVLVLVLGAIALQARAAERALAERASSERASAEREADRAPAGAASGAGT